MPDNTVVGLLVSPQKRFLLSQAGFDLTEFKELRTADDNLDYVNEEKGILIHTYESDSGDKIVKYFKFTPTANDEKEKCLKVTSKVENQTEHWRSIAPLVSTLQEVKNPETGSSMKFTVESSARVFITPEWV